ncbi:hypothetical protein EZV62_019519 [Acer yangbiense]|uniref:Uncharacterized protein n=1 Tax=Acer yangbiense TaxID=1000413 RepID=A0A5C7HAN4_9ROSI|nr:hypothetical protein EZV62_019519 [Acer yangbiense]
MVLWEITLGTAYFLGLKRAYRLALKIQRRVITPKHPKIRQFAHRNFDREQFELSLVIRQSSCRMILKEGSWDVGLLAMADEYYMDGELDDTLFSCNECALKKVASVAYEKGMICGASATERRIRAVFDVALKVHQNIQQRDIEVGRNLGNWILRWLDRMKPSAQIRAPSLEIPPHGSSPNMNMTSKVMKSSKPKTPGIPTPKNQESDRHLFTASKNIWGKPFPTITMMMRPPRPAGTITQYRHLWINRPDTLRLSYKRDGFDGVLRKDIMQWLQN